MQVRLYIETIGRSRIVYALLALFCAALVGLMTSHSASASMATNSRLNYGNAYAYCHPNGSYEFARGMVWLSNDEGDYYSERVAVATGATSVYVSIRGAVNTCSTSFGDTTYMYAINVSTSWLSGMSGNSFYRGAVPGGARDAWSSEGTKLYGTLNVSGVATCTAASLITGYAEGTVVVSISRQQYQTRPYSPPYSYTFVGGAGTEDVPVTVRRTCPTYNYNLIPSITNIADNTPVDSGYGAYPVAGNVTNEGPTTSKSTDWGIEQVVYAPGVAPRNQAGGTSSQTGCNYFTNNGSVGTCSVIASGNEVFAKGTVPKNGPGVVGDLPVGTKICYALSVRPYNQSTSDARHSPLKCLIVSKSPKVQVYGGDLVVGRGYNSSGTKISSSIITSVTNKSGTYYGSWAEYAMVPSNAVEGMASGSGYAGGVGTMNLCSGLSLLTFANATNATSPSCNSANIGKYTLASSSQLEAIQARFATSSGATTLTGNVDVRSLISGTIYPGSGTINLSASEDMPAGKWVVINAPNATVRITSSLHYTSAALTSVQSIPQLIIIAQNIVIQDNVDTVDAWLLAKGTGANGTLTTCDASITEPTQLTASVCSTKLTINGPVIANHVNLYRTAGSGTGTASGDPAEVFNLRPDAYMWASNFSGLESKARTVYQTELPPRF